MTIVAVDTSTDYLSLAILKDDLVLAKFHKKADMRHSVLLVPVIDKLLKKAEVRLKDIDCFAISVGPGSFTGLRIGVTVVKGLSYALKKPIVSVPTLDVIAHNAVRFKGIICPVLDARKNKVYACIYKSDGKTLKRLTRYLLLPAADLLERIARYDKVMFLGDAEKRIQENMSFERSYSSRSQDQSLLRKDWHPKAETVARLGMEYFKKKRFTKAQALEPMYLYSRECDVTGK
jgi:tRNA threonylcarbamoyladenosine biosynthesis protein TsaB